MCCGGNWVSSTFYGPNFNPEADFDWHQLYDPDGDEQVDEVSSTEGIWATSKVRTDNSIPAAPSLAWLWGKALAEWRDLDSSASE